MGKRDNRNVRREKVFSLNGDSKDVEWQYFRSGGPGGQNQNKRSSGARVVHHPSNARGESREERSQLQNRKIAWRRMVESPKFRAWLAIEVSSRPTPEELVDSDMKPENIKVEVFENGEWVEKTFGIRRSTAHYKCASRFDH